MARLPSPGGDEGNWGTILNDFLNQAHKSDGNIKTDAIDAAALKSGSVTSAGIKDGAVTNVKLQDNSVSTAKLQDDAVTADKLNISGTPSADALIRYDAAAPGMLKWDNATSNAATFVVKNTNNTWPARPAGVDRVVWIGPGAPDPSPAVASDIWVDTTP